MTRQCFGCLAAVTACFATHQVVGLNGCGAFVNGQNFGITVVLRSTCLFNETHATVNLHAQGSDFQTHLCAVALDQRHHEFVEQGILFAHFCIWVVMCRIVGRCSNRGQSAAAFCGGAHGHEHAFDIGVMNDGSRCVHAAIDRTALHTVFGVLNGFLIGTLCNGNTLNANSITRSVHHDEHVFKATVFLAYQIADGAAVIAILKHSGRAGLDAHLVFNADTVNIVAGT